MSADHGDYDYGVPVDDDPVVLPFDAGARARARGALNPPSTEQPLEQPQDEASDRPRIAVEDWLTFRSLAGERVPFLVEGLWPEGALGFIASPPKKGKTWIALGLALSVATGSDYLGAFKVTEPRSVLYVALEGHRAAIEARIAVLARGLGLDPREQIERLAIAYKPRGVNLAEPRWSEALLEAALGCGAKLVIVDVLRSAARIKENDASEFAALAFNLSPLAHAGIGTALLHHFTKLSETSKERTPMERMSGSGAMGGVLDVGIYITGSEDDARRLRIEFDCRDVASPRPLSVELAGDGSGPHGTLTRDDKAWWTASDHEVSEDEVKVPSEEIADWIREQGEDVVRAHIAAVFECSEKTITRREPRLEQLGVEIVRKQGRPNIYRFVGVPEEDPQQTLDTNTCTQDTTPDTHPGQTPDTTPVSDLKPALESHSTPDTAEPRTNDPCPGSEAPFQADLDPGHPGHPTGVPLPVSGVVPPGAQTPATEAELERLLDLYESNPGGNT